VFVELKTNLHGFSLLPVVSFVFYCRPSRAIPSVQHTRIGCYQKGKNQKCCAGFPAAITIAGNEIADVYSFREGHKLTVILKNGKEYFLLLPA